ncbi:MAG: BatD family protein, partial [Dokdonia sp.]|nr:BatD family protein [Dokdonia sp.]
MREQTHMKAITLQTALRKISRCLTLSFFVFAIAAQAQTDPLVTATVDTTSIRLGEQVSYLLEVQAEKGKVVVFPEGQTFNPMEVIESYAIDTTFADAKMTLIKKYGLTQFDSGSYKIPSQRIRIGEKMIQTDSFRIEVANVILDTVNQGLYDIKPAIELPKDYSNWWKYVLWILPIALAIGAFLFWLLKRNRKQKEAEKYVPPFDQALASLKSLDESDFISSQKYKEYYSVLTDTLRRYYDEKVYNHALESTTDELIA